jgi:hypothetical protein
MIFSGSERAVQCIMKKEKDPRKILAAQKRYYVSGFSPDVRGFSDFANFGFSGLFRRRKDRKIGKIGGNRNISCFSGGQPRGLAKDRPGRSNDGRCPECF